MLTKQNLNILNQTQSLRAMHTIVRDARTSRQDFLHYANRINRLLLEEALNHLPYEAQEIQTPTDISYDGLKVIANVCGVSIVRAGESMEMELRSILPDAQIGKILIQRDEGTKQPHWLYTKLPPGIEDGYVLLLEPMLATGGSAAAAIDILIKKGVSTDKIILVTVLSTEQGINAIHSKSEDIKIITSAVDDGLNDEAYIVPGIGDYGDRFFGTE